MLERRQVKASVDANEVEPLDVRVVEAWQRRLHQKIDGWLGPKTTLAVAAWQRVKGLIADGWLGPQTQETAPPEIKELASRADREAIDYNERKAQAVFVDPTTWAAVKPATVEGVRWVRGLQASLKLTVDGKLGPNSTRAFERRYGAMSMHVQSYVLPWWVSRWGYDHAHDPGSRAWPPRDEQWAAMLLMDAWVGAMLALVSGFKPDNDGTTNRGPDSAVTLDRSSLGPWHVWSRGLPEYFAWLVARQRSLLDQVNPWDERELVILGDPAALADAVPFKRGRMPHEARFNWLIAGWWRIARHPQWVEAQCQWWLDKYVAQGLSLVRERGWERALRGEDGGRILAAVTRLCNSGQGSARRRIRAGSEHAGSDDPMTVIEETYLLHRDRGGYGKPSRFARILAFDGFKGPAPSSFTAASGLDLDVAPRRPGSSEVLTW